MDLKEKASYVKGLLEGLNLDYKNENNKILKIIVDLFQEVVEKLQEVESVSYENSALIDELDEDLANVEKDFYNRKEINNSNCKHKGFNNRCNCSNGEEDEGENFQNKIHNDLNEDVEYEVSCPNCKRVVALTDEIFSSDEEEIICPECGGKINFDFKDSEKL